jgi:hypothetical protein
MDCEAMKTILTKKDSKPRWIRWALLLQEFDLQILDRRRIKNAKVQSALMEVKRLEEPKSKFCIPYDMLVSLTGITEWTFGNTDPPTDYLSLPTPKSEVRKVHDFDKSSYPNDLCQHKLERIEHPTSPTFGGRRKMSRISTRTKFGQSESMDHITLKSYFAHLQGKLL